MKLYIISNCVLNLRICFQVLGTFADIAHHEFANNKSSVRHRTAIKLQTVTEVVERLMIGKRVANAKDASLFINHLAAWFTREPHLLQSVLRDLISADPRMRKVLFSVMVDVPQVENLFAQQNLSLKYGGRIPQRRWSEQFSPILTRTVLSQLRGLLLHCSVLPAKHVSNRVAQ